MSLDVETYEKLIPRALKKAREHADLTVEEVAARTRISIPAIQNYEWGKNLPLMPYFLSLLHLYRLNLGQFHDIVIDIYNDQHCEETSKHISDLEERLSRLEEAAGAETRVH